MFKRLMSATVGIACSCALMVTEARASPITLLCDTRSPQALGPAIIVLDEAARTATFTDPGIRIEPNAPVPARQYGPVTADFDSQAVRFAVDRGTDFDTFYTINRLTGIVEARVTLHSAPSNRQLDYSWQCRPGTPQF